MKTIRVAIWGFGAMGSGIGKMIASKQGIQVSGVCDKWDELVGKEMYDYLGVDRAGRPEVIITASEAEIVDRDKTDIVILATDSFVKAQFDKIMFCLERSVPVISTAEEMAWPWAQNKDLADKIDAEAKKRGVAVLGTGINPGFVLDYLILAASGTCEDVESIKGARINDLAPFGKAVMEEQGVGISVEEFEERIAADTLAGHVGFPESIEMMARGMGVKIKNIEQTREPIITNVDRTSAYGFAGKGSLAGIRQQAYARDEDGEVFYHLDHPQQICPEDEGVSTGDYVTIHADGYDMNLSIVPETPGGIGTISMVVNMIPHVLGAKAGLRSMLDLPVPRAILGDFTEQVDLDPAQHAVRKKGDYVVVQRVVLSADERAPQVPEDTAQVPLIALFKGYLEDECAVPGDEVNIITMSGRRAQAVLTARDPSAQHSYGRFVPELMQVHRQVRDLVFGGDEA